MCAVRIGQIAGHINLMRFHFGNQITHDLDICLGHRKFFDLSRLIKRQIKEMYMVERNLIESARRTRLATTNQPFDRANIGRINVALFLFSKVFLDFLIFLFDHFVFVFIENLIETVDEMHKTRYLFVSHSNITRGLVSHVHVVTLLYQSAQCTAH